MAIMCQKLYPLNARQGIFKLIFLLFQVNLQSWLGARLTQLKLLSSIYGLENAVEFHVFDNVCEFHICIGIQLSTILQYCFVKKWAFDVHIGQYYSVHEKWFS